MTTADQPLTPDDSAFKNLQFAANAGTAKYHWLIKQQEAGHITQVPITGLNTESTWKMLEKNRFDVLLENKQNLDKILQTSDFDKNNFNIYLTLKKPLGIYLSKEYLSHHPDFMESFNQALKGCL